MTTCLPHRRAVWPGLFFWIVLAFNLEFPFMRFTRRCVSFIVLCGLASFAAAQSATSRPAPQPTSQEYAERNQRLEQAALQVAEMVDQGKAAQVWNGASGTVKKLVSLDVFVQNVSRDRKTVGALVNRRLATLSFSSSDGKSLPAGLYANVAFATRFANEKQPVRELISFRLDGDHVWRVTGYTLR